jgi:cytoskeletal protein RodZ
MKKTLLLIAPLSMLALAACNKSETPAADTETDVPNTTAAAPVEMPPAITASKVYRCADSTVLYVDYFGKNEAADIRVGDKTAAAVRVTAPMAEAPADGAAPAADAKPAGPMKSADGTTSLTIADKNVNVKLGDKGAQSCKGS